MPVEIKNLPPLSGVDLCDPENKRDYNRGLFREVAPAYDRITGVLSFGRDKRWKARLMESLPEAGVDVCVDLACGTGDLTRAAARRYPGARMVGLDLSEAMMGPAVDEFSTADGVCFVQGDMAALPFPNESVDVVTGGYALRNAADLDRALSEIARVLKPGGRAAFLDFSKSPAVLPRYIALWVLGFWGSLWGLWFHRNPDVYRYIAVSLRGFPDRRALGQKFLESGLTTVKTVYFFFGLMELRLVEKRPS